MAVDQNGTIQGIAQGTATITAATADGKGKAVYSDGRHYEGRFKKGMKKDTSASFTDRKGSVFTGTYDADTLVTGKLVIVGGHFVFEGTFSQDKPYNGTWRDQDNQPIVKVVNGIEEN